MRVGGSARRGACARGGEAWAAGHGRHGVAAAFARVATIEGGRRAAGSFSGARLSGAACARRSGAACTSQLEARRFLVEADSEGGELAASDGRGVVAERLHAAHPVGLVRLTLRQGNLEVLP